MVGIGGWGAGARALAAGAALLLLAAWPAQARDLGEALRDRLESGVGIPVSDREGQDLLILAKFYESRRVQPVWVTAGGPTARARALFAQLARAEEDGLDPADYGLARIGALLERGDSPDALAELEFLLTHAVLDYGRDLGSGRLEPSRVDPELFVERREVDPARLLAEAAEAGDVAAYLSRFAPTRPEYARLRLALKQYRELLAAGGWEPVPAGETLKPGQSDPRVPALRRRLAATGDLPGTDAPPPDPLLFDPVLERGVRAFQRRHGLEPDGEIGKRTLAEMNVPARLRVAQIILNMERWRWMPDDLGPRYLAVNLADYTLAVMQGMEVVETMRVVVGAPYTRTPVFSGTMTYLELNPYWHVPPRIAKEEILPKQKKDPLYLAKNRYTLLSDWSESAVPVDPATVDWKKVTPANFRWRVRQDPGDHNALGRIKFMFPNRFDVYLHDTPSKSHFARAMRSFSHGCIRVEDPPKLALALLSLAETPDWTPESLAAALASGERRVVRLKKPLPVHITYITAFVDGEGRVQFRGDVYGRDRRLGTALDAARAVWPDPEEPAAGRRAGAAEPDPATE
ncbi:MAG TPA: L,D-transpeptidase family protein [Azospirillaceae bacterium]|nr:L,D-transpeptidase family protein [Azospirillaceae bacterium]